MTLPSKLIKPWLTALFMATAAMTAPQEIQALLIAECQDMAFIESQAAIIIEGEVIEVSSQKEKNGNIFTYIKIQVHQYLRGSGPEVLTIKQFGGTYEENGQVVAISDGDSPSFTVGEKGAFYLQQPDTPFYADQFFTTVCDTGVIKL